MKRVGWLFVSVLAVGLVSVTGCESAPEEPPVPPADAPTEDPGSDAPADAPEEDSKPAPQEDDAFKVPEGVEHVENPDVQDIPTPTDMPDFKDKPASAAFKKVNKKHNAAFKKACKKNKGAVIRLVEEGTRIGYVSYKNTNLPVKGLFEKAQGYAVFGKKPEVKFWIDPLSLNSGDAVRTRKLLKLFFELEDKGNAPFTFSANTIEGELPAEDGATSNVTFKGELTLHGKSAPTELTFAVTQSGEGYTAKLANGVELLQFAPYGLVEPLKALIKSCNHSAMGTAVNLEIELALAKGCK